MLSELLEELAASGGVGRNVERSAEVGSPPGRAEDVVDLERERRGRREDLRRRLLRELLHLLVHAEEELGGARERGREVELEVLERAKRGQRRGRRGARVRRCGRHRAPLVRERDANHHWREFWRDHREGYR